MQFQVDRSRAKLLVESKIFLRKKQSSLIDGITVTCAPKSEVEPYVGIYGGTEFPRSMGAFSYSNSKEIGSWRIGRYCSIAKNIRILGNAHPLDRITSSPVTYQSLIGHEHVAQAVMDFDGTFETQSFQSSPKSYLTIGNDVWIGQDVTFKAGITVGDGAVIAAGALVVKNVAPYSIVGGNPARIIRQRFPYDVVEKLQSTQWWKYKFTDFQDLDTANPSEFCAELNERISSGAIQEFSPQKIRIASLLGAVEQGVAALAPS